MTIVSSCNLTENEFNAVFPNVPANIRTSNFDALVKASIAMGVEWVSVEQKATFLGTVKFNTRNLESHVSSCVASNTCQNYSSSTCSEQTTAIKSTGGRLYYPRSAMMIAYPCGYAHVDAILNQALPAGSILSVLASPSLLSDDLFYSYLASLAVWTDLVNSTASCLNMTMNTTSTFAKCQAAINPWECTPAGHVDSNNHLAAIAAAGLALDAGFTADLTGCAAADPMTTEPVTTAPATTAASTVAPVTTTASTVAPVTCIPVPTTTAPATSAPSCTCVNMTAAPTCSATSPMPLANSTLACGSVSMGQFVDMFNATSSDADLALQFDALAAACAITQVEQLDVNQASFLLGAAAFYSGNLTNVGATVTDVFGFRGVFLMGGSSSYEAMTAWIAKNNASAIPSCDLVANSKLVADNAVISWLSALFFMQLSDAKNRTVLQLVSAGQFGAAVAVEDVKITFENQKAMFAMIQSASIVLGQEISTDTLFRSVVNATITNHHDEELVSSVTTSQPMMPIIMAVTALISFILV